MFKLAHKVNVALVAYLLLALIATPSFAGSSEAELKYEISFLAKKLLDISGEDSITVEQPAYMKPFIGICSSTSLEGVKLTCITPGHNAAKAGLKTGDLIIAINDIDVTGIRRKGYSNAYYSVTKKMKTGDKLAMTLIRKGVEQVITVTVGAVSHPAYTLTVKKK